MKGHLIARRRVWHGFLDRPGTEGLMPGFRRTIGSRSAPKDSAGPRHRGCPIGCVGLICCVRMDAPKPGLVSRPLMVCDGAQRFGNRYRTLSRIDFKRRSPKDAPGIQAAKPQSAMRSAITGLCRAREIVLNKLKEGLEFIGNLVRWRAPPRLQGVGWLAIRREKWG